MSELIEKRLIQSENSGKKFDHRGFILYISFVALIVAILYFVQYSLLSGMIPVDIAQNYFYFNYESPNIYSLFLSKFIHNPENPMHLQENVTSFLTISFIIGVLYFYFFPVVKIKMPDYFLPVVYFMIIFLVPFMVSMISYIYREIGVINLDIQYSIGFSGTIWALFGFMFFLSAIFCLKTISLALKDNTQEDFARIISVCLPLILAVALMIILPVFIILVDVNTNKNVYAHLAGFLYGWLIPIISGTFLVSPCWRCRIGSIILIGALFLIPVLITGFLAAF